MDSMEHDTQEFVRKNLNLGKRHAEWADENNINLSAEVRDLLDERIDD